MVFSLWTPFMFLHFIVDILFNFYFFSNYLA
jgi:hypothetical protein